jgi:hypothetical protein
MTGNKLRVAHGLLFTVAAEGIAQLRNRQQPVRQMVTAATIARSFRVAGLAGEKRPVLRLDEVHRRRNCVDDRAPAKQAWGSARRACGS